MCMCMRVVKVVRLRRGGQRVKESGILKGLRCIGCMAVTDECMCGVWVMYMVMGALV